jgi:hypothetical protein
MSETIKSPKDKTVTLALITILSIPIYILLFEMRIKGYNVFLLHPSSYIDGPDEEE